MPSYIPAEDFSTVASSCYLELRKNLCAELFGGIPIKKEIF